MNKDVIPKGFYCYKGGYICPYYTTIKDEGVYIPYCKFLKLGSVDNQTTKPEFEILKKKYGSAKKVFEKYPLDLLWDMVKECEINMNIN